MGFVLREWVLAEIDDYFVEVGEFCDDEVLLSEEDHHGLRARHSHFGEV